MSEHLPECTPEIRVELFSSSGDRCQTCAALRACEARMEAGWQIIADNNYRLGVQAARDAVAAIRASAFDQGIVSREYILAALDALRGES